MLDTLLLIVLATIITLVTTMISHIASDLHGAPYVPMKKKLVKQLLKFGELVRSDNFFDLGSGDGRILISAVNDFGVSEATGYEVAIWPYLEAKFLIFQKRLGKSIQVYRQSFFRANLAGADFVYMYLYPELVNRLAGKISAECRPGMRVLCPSFPIDLAANPRFKLLKTAKFAKITAYLYELT